MAWGKNQGEAYSRACSFVDEFEEMEAKSRIFNERYAVMKYLYLMIIYISSTDQHNFYLNNNQEKSKENFTSVSCWNGFDFKIIDNLESEGLLELSSTKTTIIMNKKGIKAAREVLKMININGVKNILEQREYHEKYINYTSPLDFIQEEEEDT